MDLSGAYFIDDNGKKHYIIREEDGKAYYIEKGKEKYVEIADFPYYIYDETPSLEAIKSEQLANEIYKSMLKLDFIEPRSWRPVQDHNLAITRWTNMPSVLIEAGPTSPEMNNVKKHNTIADRIVEAIQTYFRSFK